ncbi:MAG: short-chain dehydrogenase, partial [Bacteroidota bacterium]|nr:short-chain dehydrogenase [Bacteroidota bacterium]
MDEGLAAGMPPEKCAQQILKAVRKNRPEAVIGGKETLMVTFRRKLPFVFFRLVSKVKPT